MVVPTAAAQDLPPLPGEKRESAALRDGFAIGIKLGTSLLAGQRELSDVTGFGPGFRLWFGTTAGENMLWQLNLGTSAYVIDDRVSPTESERKINNSTRITLGLQYYLRPTFWVRGAAGLAGFAKRDGQIETLSKVGFGLNGGAGLDLYRRGIFVVDLEIVIAAAIYGGASAGSGSLLVGANWY